MMQSCRRQRQGKEKLQMIKEYIAVDLETTGLNPVSDAILEIGAARIRDGEVTDTFETFVNSGVKVPANITALTGITQEMADSGMPYKRAVEEFLRFCGGLDLLGHNLPFDFSFLKCKTAAMGLPLEKSGIDTLKISRKFLPHLDSRSLESLCTFFEIPQEKKHRAGFDAMAASRLYLEMGRRYERLEPEAFLPVPLIYRIKKESSITNSQKRYLLDLVKYHRIELNASVDGMTKSEASKMIDRIISKYGKIKR